MMAHSGENLRHSIVRFVHQIVENQQRSLTAVERINVGQPIVKLYVFHLVKEILIYSVTPLYFLRRRIDQSSSVFDKFTRKYRFARAAGTGDDGRKRTLKNHD